MKMVLKPLIPLTYCVCAFIYSTVHVANPLNAIRTQHKHKGEREWEEASGGREERMMRKGKHGKIIKCIAAML